MGDVAEFESWLRKGLGRAAVYLQSHDPAPFRQRLLYACTHCVSYDPQCEDSRAPYVRELIALAGDPASFRDGVLRALAGEGNDADDFDLGLTLGVARGLVESGDAEMKAAMYDALRRAGFSEAGSQCEEVIRLDGLDGLRFAAGLFTAQFPEEELWQIGGLIDALEERDGKDAAHRAIAAAEAHSPALGAMLQAHRRFQDAHDPAADARRTPPDYPTLRQMFLDGKADWRVDWRAVQWGRKAGAEDLEAAARGLVRETDPDRMVGWLRIFFDRAFPLAPDRLIELAQSETRRIARGAITALAHLQHPQVRAFALRLLEQSGRKGDGVRLLSHNYQSGDFAQVHVLITEATDADEIHNLGIAVKRVLDIQAPPEAVPSLLWLYEHGPCSLCRHSFVKHLLALGQAPAWMREECRYDAYSATRTLVYSQGECPRS